MQKFCLVLNTSISKHHFHWRVSAAVRHKVQELDLSLPFKTFFLLPKSLFTSEALSILKLDMAICFWVPSFVHFSNLKILHLTITFPSDQCTERFFAGCLVLQELVFSDYFWIHNERVNTAIPI